MKHVKYFIIVIIIFCNLSSCKKDFLKVVDKTVLLKEGYVFDLETTAQFMNGIYLDLGSYYLNGNYMPYPEIMGDNMKPATSDMFVAAYNWDFSPIGKSGEGDPIYFWLRYYAIIRNCSFVIEKASEYEGQNLNKANDIKGQALAIRAMMHFTLVNIFAQSYNFTTGGSHPGIPYIRTSDVASTVSRQTVAEVYDFMINDLKEAIRLFPKANLVKELMNYQAAKALLSRVYLFKEDYANSKKLAVEILKDVPAITTNYPANLYTANDAEALFRMSPKLAEGEYAVFIGFYSTLESGLNYVATNDIAQLLRENINDKRSAWVKDTLNTWQIRKFPTGVAKQFVIPEGDYYQTLFRSSEMCLTAAETYAKLNMEDSARFYIDIIRKRAYPGITSIDVTGGALIDSICKERRKEMAFDGLRMFDLLRWKKGVNRIDAENPTAQTLPYPSNKAIAALPKSDVDLLGLPQNAGY